MNFNFDPNSPTVRRAHRRLADAYARKPGAEVPVVEPGGYRRKYSTQERLADLDKMLEDAVGWANAMAASESDWAPFIDTFVGVCLVPEAFGCPVVHTPGADPWTEPRFNEIGKVWDIKMPKVGESYLARRLSDWVDYAQRRLGVQLPIWTMDIQSPFSVAARVVEPMELMTACFTDPRAVHHLCQMITDFSIELTRTHLAQMEHPSFPGRNFPSISENIGICIADDTPLIMLSPEMYREFSLPYNQQIGEALGGVHIHSCGDYRHNLDNLLATPSVRSIQLHAGRGEFALPQTTDEDCAFNRARGRVTMLVDANPISWGDAYRGRPKDFYAEYFLPRLRNASMTGVILQSCGPCQDLPTVKAALEWTRRQVEQP